MTRAPLIAAALFFCGLEAHAFTPCAPQGGTGLEAIQGEQAGSQVYSGAQMQVRVGVHKGAGERVDTQATLAALVARKADLLKMGWLVPAVGSVMSPVDTGSAEQREVLLTLVSAPEAAGDHEATLPSLPIVIRQTSGAKVTLCTSEHHVKVVDPTDENAATPRHDAPPLPELETWVAARWAIACACVALPLLAWLATLWIRRTPQKSGARGPQATPFQRASDALASLHTQKTMPTDRMADAATDAFRSYLAEAHGLRALECTTAELVARLGAVESTRRHEAKTLAWLTEADAIKFAARQLTQAERTEFLAAGAALLKTWDGAP